MRVFVATALHRLSKNLPLLAAGLTVLVIWRVAQIIYAPNLLINPGFDIDEAAGWTVSSQGAGRAVAKPVEDKPGNIGLELDIAESAGASWVGVGQRVPIEPKRRYRVSIDYRLTSGNSTASKVVLRLAQLDGAGNSIKTDDISDPEPLIADPNDEGQLPWTTLTHSFESAGTATMLEVGSGLFGQQATTVEIDAVSLQAYPSRLSTLGQNIAISILLVLLVMGSSHKLFVGQTSTRLIVRPVILIATNIVLFLIFAELIALGLYFIRSGELFYTNKKSYLLVQEGDTEDLTRHRIHPYFGYTLRTHWERELVHNGVNLTATTNNYGLFSDRDYPFIKSNERQYIIGIFGGSVSEEFYILARNRLVNNLHQAEFFADKELVVLNFAKAGYKQPQQILILSYLLATEQQLDLVINIDGFNELSGSVRNNQQHVDISMPHTGIMKNFVDLTDQTTLTSEKLQSFAKIDQYRSQLNNLIQRIDSSNLASVSFVLDQYYEYIFGQYRREINRSEALQSSYSRASLLFIQPSDQVLEDTILFERVASNWAIASVMMNQLQQESNGLYYHFVQPNQYYSKKIFTDFELKEAINPTHQYKPASEEGYPFLIAKRDFLEGNVDGFFDAVHIFDSIAESTYRDDCCHYTQLGYDILADFVAESIIGSQNLHDQQVARD